MIVRVASCLALSLLLPLACAGTPEKQADFAPTAKASAPVASVPHVPNVVGDSATSAPSSVAVEPSSTPAPSASTGAAEGSPPAPTGIVIGEGTRVFLFGDSMVNAGLGQRLQKLVKERGALYDDNNWSSSTVKKWSESERLPNLLFKAKPDVVFIVIGANEVYNDDPVHQGAAVQKIVKKLGGKPCVWIGPPVWKTQKGIVEAERDNAAPCVFFDSSKLELERQKDGIHPSLKGGAAWAEAVWSATIAPKEP